MCLKMSCFYYILAALMGLVLLPGPVCFAQGQLTPSFYDQSCPNVTNVIRQILVNAALDDPRLPASFVRLHFHDCFVQGCDASILLDDPETTEKTAIPNINSARGYEVIDAMKEALENVCNQTVSCADILTIAAKESVFLAGGPSYEVPLGRLDGVTASRALANTSLPAFFESIDEIKAKFAAVGLNTTLDVVALSGAHTFGRAQCFTFAYRLYDFTPGSGDMDPNLNETFAAKLRVICPEIRTDNLTDLDHQTVNAFDNSYFKNLQVGEGLLESDQILFSDGADTTEIVNLFSSNQTAFFESFVESMIRMGNIPMTDPVGEVRLNCRVRNPNTESISTTSDSDSRDAVLLSSI